MKKYLLPFSFFVLLAYGCSDAGNNGASVDQRSYRLGIIGAFGEIVNAGVKKLALSEPTTPKEMDEMIDEAKVIADRNHVLLYRETELLVTDLFPASYTQGKEVLLIYQGATKDEYLTLKQEVWKLQQEGAYSSTARESISRRFGKLLSYSDEYITKLMAENAAGASSVKSQ